MGNKKERCLTRQITKHMGMDPQGLPIIIDEIPRYKHPNVHLAIQHFMQHRAKNSKMRGLPRGNTDLSELLDPAPVRFLLRAGAPQNVRVAIGIDKYMICVDSAIFFFEFDNEPLVLVMHGESGFFSTSCLLQLQVLARRIDVADRFLKEIRDLVDKDPIYRGQTISFNGGQEGTFGFTKLTPVSRDEIILPTGLLERVERQTIGASKHKNLLLASNKRIKRGVLLYGPPGTGKSLLCKHIVTNSPGRTTLIAAGGALSDVNTICQLARWLAPSIVVLEDIDLIANDREFSLTGGFLMDLMNQMDGIADDADVLFLLTTNRAEALEQALKNRPGRVDQAYEISLPDEQGRRKMLELFLKDVRANIVDIDRVVRRTEKASGAFLYELVRKALLFAADEEREEDVVLLDRHIDSAYHELLTYGGAITRNMLASKEIGFANLG